MQWSLTDLIADISLLYLTTKSVRMNFTVLSRCESIRYCYNNQLKYFKTWHHSNAVVIVIKAVFGIRNIVHLFIVYMKT
jgi:hypothetical protein